MKTLPKLKTVIEELIKSVSPNESSSKILGVVISNPDNIHKIEISVRPSNQDPDWDFEDGKLICIDENSIDTKVLLESGLVNLSEVARILGWTASQFHNKLNEKQGQRMLKKDWAQINNLFERFTGEKQ